MVQDLRLGHPITRRGFLRTAVIAGVAFSALDRLGEWAMAAEADAPRRLVQDVLRFSTRPQGWKGAFGFVTFRLHPVFFDGQRAYHIRTDASDAAFAKRVGLVHVPKLSAALKAGAVADYYLFTNGSRSQLPVVSTVPGVDNYTPAFRLHRVTFTGTARLLNSVSAIKDAQSSGLVKIDATPLAVNYPFVRWPSGELPVDKSREAYLGGGQLLSAPDVSNRQVTFKLQQCFPGEWYIVTDTSASPMAPMMRIAASPGAAPLTKAGATAKILVFGGGIKGPGPMGFQPSIVDSRPANPVWSPFWDHFTFTWENWKKPVVVKHQNELLDLEKAGALKRWPGTPDTQGQLFIVNCPIPVSGPVRWRA